MSSNKLSGIDSSTDQTSNDRGKQAGTHLPEPMTLVNLEFTAAAKTYDITSIAKNAIPEATVLTIDPLDIPERVRWKIDDHVLAICDAIRNSAKPQASTKISLISSCTAGKLASRVGSQLTRQGINVTGVAALDPVRVRYETIADALHEIASSLGHNLPDPEIFRLSDPDHCDIPVLERTIRSWTRAFARQALPLGPETEPIIAELEQRYITWVSFLCTSAWATECRLERMTIFTSLERFAEGDFLSVDLPAHNINSYQTNGAPCLTSEKCISDLTNWLIASSAA